MNSKPASLSLLILLIGGCAEPQVQDPSEPAQQAIEQAEARYRESQTAGHAWMQTKVHLENAKQSLQGSDFASAQAEAERALALADASLVQAQAEQSAWRDRFPAVRPTSE